MTQHAIVDRETWLQARQELLAQEKAFTRQRDELSRQRRALPWVKVDKPYVFEAPAGQRTLADLFDGRSQLIVYHFMFRPDWEHGCPSCSFLSDHIDGCLPHLAHRDVTLTVVSRAPLPQITAFKQRMGWRFPWVSSYGSDFNRDLGVSFTSEDNAEGRVHYNYRTLPAGLPGLPEEMHGTSVFYRDDDGSVYHTYSTYGRGTDLQVNTYNYLDLVPKGRDEDRYAFPMAWMRHHDRYDDSYQVDPTARYKTPRVVTSCCQTEAETETESYRY